jgi:hypothetical protein
VRRVEGSRGPEGDAYLYGGDTKYCGTEREVCWPRPGLERKSQGRGIPRLGSKDGASRSGCTSYLVECKRLLRQSREGRQVRGGGRCYRPSRITFRAAPPSFHPAVHSCPKFGVQDVSVSTRPARRLGRRGLGSTDDRVTLTI